MRPFLPRHEAELTSDAHGLELRKEYPFARLFWLLFIVFLWTPGIALAAG
jgi:hypothetical protein